MIIIEKCNDNLFIFDLEQIGIPFVSNQKENNHHHPINLKGNQNLFCTDRLNIKSLLFDKY